MENNKAEFKEYLKRLQGVLKEASERVEVILDNSDYFWNDKKLKDHASKMAKRFYWDASGLEGDIDYLIKKKLYGSKKENCGKPKDNQ